MWNSGQKNKKKKKKRESKRDILGMRKKMGKWHRKG
jgi:hypothetical protein